MSALTKATREIFKQDAPALDLAGSTDRGIVLGLFEYFRKPYDPILEERFYQCYLPNLQCNLEDDSFGGRLLPGVREVLETLTSEGHHLGLLTGNIERGASIKCRHYQLAQYFSYGAYGDDHWDRNELGPIVTARAEQVTGRNFQPNEILVIGDTPKDVACAHAFGVECVAVATGAFDEEQLRICGADRVLRDLVDFRI